MAPPHGLYPACEEEAWPIVVRQTVVVCRGKLSEITESPELAQGLVLHLLEYMVLSRTLEFAIVEVGEFVSGVLVGVCVRCFQKYYVANCFQKYYVANIRIE